MDARCIPRGTHLHGGGGLGDGGCAGGDAHGGGAGKGGHRGAMEVRRVTGIAQRGDGGVEAHLVLASRWKAADRAPMALERSPSHLSIPIRRQRGRRLPPEAPARSQWAPRAQPRSWATPGARAGLRTMQDVASKRPHSIARSGARPAGRLPCPASRAAAAVETSTALTIVLVPRQARGLLPMGTCELNAAADALSACCRNKRRRDDGPAGNRATGGKKCVAHPPVPHACPHACITAAARVLGLGR